MKNNISKRNASTVIKQLQKEKSHLLKTLDVLITAVAGVIGTEYIADELDTAHRVVERYKLKAKLSRRKAG